jgi:hypothetical protein
MPHHQDKGLIFFNFKVTKPLAGFSGDVMYVGMYLTVKEKSQRFYCAESTLA